MYNWWLFGFLLIVHCIFNMYNTDSATASQVKYTLFDVVTTVAYCNNNASRHATAGWLGFF